MKKKIAIVLCAILCMFVGVLPSFAIGGNIPVNWDGLTQSELDSVDDYKSVPQPMNVQTGGFTTPTFGNDSVDANRMFFTQPVIEGIYKAVMSAYYQGLLMQYVPVAFAFKKDALNTGNPYYLVVLCAQGTSSYPVWTMTTNSSGRESYNANYQLRAITFTSKGFTNVATSAGSSAFDLERLCNQFVVIHYEDWENRKGTSYEVITQSTKPTYGESVITDASVTQYIELMEVRRILLGYTTPITTQSNDYSQIEQGIYVNGYNDGYDTGLDYGYNAGYEDGEANGGMTPEELESIYNEGYDAGVTRGEEIGYTNGFEIGQNVGFDAGYERGENDGYVEGQRDGSAEIDIPGVIDSYFEGARTIFEGWFDYTIFGVNIMGLLAGLVVVAIVFFVLKKVK